MSKEWSDEEIQTLKVMWNEEGASASAIARALGTGRSRNAVLGRVHRMGLLDRPAVAARSRTPRPRPCVPVPPRAQALAPFAPVLEEDPLTLADGGHVTILNISDRMCRWPIGDPSKTDFHFCGHSPKTDSPYCEAHARKAYQPRGANSKAATA